MQVGDRVRTDLVDGLEELEVRTPVGPGAVLRLAAEPGAWVRAVRPGAVTDIGVGPLGILVKGDDGNTYFYGHLESLNVHAQQRVEAGRTLGQVGLDPGQAAELWFEVIDADGTPLDPAGFLTVVAELAAAAPPLVPPDSEDPAHTQAAAEGSEPEVIPAPVPAPRSADNALAEELRARGWTVEPPAPPGPRIIPGNGGPGV